jgi:lipoprotein-anchoring transpeptidase ErfK/SrfK
MTDQPKKMTRRLFASSVATGTLFAPAVFAQTDTALEQELAQRLERQPTATGRVRRNISNFKTKNWQPYFNNTNGGAILVDTKSRALHYWNDSQNIYRLYPTSVPITPELTKLGRTKIVRKRVGPDWRPTPAMKKRNPEWPDYIPPGPDNPLGTHALYLSWTYYRIHGTHDTRKIGRRSSNGCIGLYNNHIADLFDLAKVGTQVLLI